MTGSRRVFVLLPDHLDVPAWQQAWRAGEAPDETPYGYHHAGRLGYEVSFSSPLQRRRGWAAWPFKLLRRLTGVDVEHAWNHRGELFGPSVTAVWTHTEREFLPVVLLALLLRQRMPRLIAQIVWLADEWPRLSRWRRLVQGALLKRVSVATCHSPANLPFLQGQAGPERARLVPFGIAPELWESNLPVARARTAGEPLRVLTLGNDRHRDWPTLAAALAHEPEWEVFIASATFPDALLAPNMTRALCDLRAIRAKYAWADVVVVPLVPNLHASGLTVVLEAVAAGKPVVVSDVGGLRHYFGPDAVHFVPPGDAQALAEQVKALGHDPEQARAAVARAREAFRLQCLDTVGYAARHVQLTETLLA